MDKDARIMGPRSPLPENRLTIFEAFNDLARYNSPGH